MRTPTERQYGILLALGAGGAGMSRTRKDTMPLLAHGWVTAERTPSFYQWVRITPDGLRALALAVERYGLPDLGSAPLVRRRVCAVCGSGRHRFETAPVERQAA